MKKNPKEFHQDFTKGGSETRIRYSGSPMTRADRRRKKRKEYITLKK